MEYALVVMIFLMLFFMVLDFSRLLYHWNMAEKATQMAARMAAVRPPACSGVTFPAVNARGTGTAQPFGTSCRAGSNVCARVEVSCSGNITNSTVSEIWDTIAPLLPPDNDYYDPSPANLCFRYDNSTNNTDIDMGFLGGPFVPVVTVEFFQQSKRTADPSYCPGGQPLSFVFVSPLNAFARALGGAATGPDVPGNIPFPSMSVSLPGEDLALGDAG